MSDKSVFSAPRDEAEHTTSEKRSAFSAVCDTHIVYDSTAQLPCVILVLDLKHHAPARVLSVCERACVYVCHLSIQEIQVSVTTTCAKTVPTTRADSPTHPPG